MHCLSSGTCVPEVGPSYPFPSCGVHGELTGCPMNLQHMCSKNRDVVPDLAPVLWHSFGTMAALVQEIMAIYPVLSPPALTATASNRVCNALALLQCVASHNDTRKLFLHGAWVTCGGGSCRRREQGALRDPTAPLEWSHLSVVCSVYSIPAHIPLFLYPFLNTNSKTRPFEYLRLTSLGVIGALVKTDETEVITFLLTTEIIPLCLRIMEMGSELSKTVATFIVQKILLDDLGLQYICQTYERFSHVALILVRLALHSSPYPLVDHHR
jgi:CCR4-NOT transcription complex subunit 9